MIKAPTLSSLLTFFLFVNLLHGQTPCSSGTAAGYPCNSIDLQAYLDLSASNLNAGSTNDIWGWTGTNGVEYALVGLNNGTSFVDISNPANPLIIGKLPKHAGTANSTWRDIKVVNNHAYIGSEATGHGIQIFDLTNLTTVSNPPVTFAEDGWISISGSNRSHNVVANELTQFIIPVGTSGLNSGGLTFYDVSDPVNPFLAGSYSSAGYSHDALCIIYRGADVDHIGKEICIGFNESQVAISDVTDKSNPSSISSFSYTGNDYCHQGWITDDHKYLLLDDELDETGPAHATRTYIFDISDLDAPFLKYTYTASTMSIDHNLYIKGPYAYQSNYTAGLRILDISDLDNNPPTEVAYFDNYPANNNGTFDGTWSVYPYFKSGNIVMTNIDGTYGGLHIIKPNLPHYVLEVMDTGIESICAGETASYSFSGTGYSGFNTMDNITVTGLPSGASATLSSNPINPNGFFTMTVNTTNSLAPGKYSIVLTGTESPVNRVSVGLEIISSNPTLPPTQLVSPANSATDQPIDLTFNWNAVPGAVFYDLEISTDQTFSTIDYSAYNLTGTSYTQNNMAYSEIYYWRVLARDNGCETSSSFFSYLFRTTADPLPVELISFSATPRSKDILLEWQTASEVGFAGFELQKSRNEYDFNKVAWYPIDGEASIAIKNYSYLDEDVALGHTYYYRLRQVDLDGTVSFSPLVSASLTENNKGLLLFPNPANHDITISFAQTLMNTKVTLKVFDSLGRMVMQNTINSGDLKNGYLMNLNDLPKGAYLLSLEDEGVVASTRFVKR